jgi:DNA polymerase (family 10)
VENTEIARLLADIGILLEIKGANPFRVRAYENAARTIGEHAVPLRDMVDRGEQLTALPGIGKDMARYVGEAIETGRMTPLEDLLQEIPHTLVDLVRLPGVGPKRARKLWQDLGVTNLAELEAAARAGRVADLEGFGEKTQERILAGIATLKQRGSRCKISDADQLVQPLIAYMQGHPGVQRLEVAGSYRRRVETVGDIDILAIASDPGPVMEHFVSYGRVRQVEMSGDTRGTVILDSGLQVDLRIVASDAYGAALQYFTGSKAHSVKLRKRAVARGLSISEYGVFDAAEPETEGAEGWAAGRRVGGATEEEVYAAVGLPWIPPELREDRGEIEAAERNALPDLLTRQAIRGDLQMHSTWSDGKHSIRQMVDACAELGYEYCALTDHSKNLAMTGGLDADAVREQWREMDDVMADRSDIRLLKSLEIDILKDGSLDLDDETIAGLDVVLVSIHTLFDLPAAQQTKRILTAIAHPAVHILAHPTGRLISRREPYAFDLEEVLHSAREHDVAVELNAHPERLDLRDTQVARARELGVKIVISTDAHHTADLDLMRYGVEQARRAWLEPKHVLNALPLAQLLGELGKRKV